MRGWFGLFFVALPLLYQGLLRVGVNDLAAATLAFGLLAAGLVFVASRVIAHKLSDLRDHPPSELRPTFVSPALEDVGARAELAFRVDDPDFTVQRLLATATTIAQRLAAGDLEAVHPFVSDGLFQRLRTQRRLSQLPLEFTGFQGRAVKGVLVAEASVGAQYQHATLRLTLGEGRDAQTVGFTLLRRRAAKTKHEGLAEAKCPHCGAGLELGATQRCRFCEAIVNSGVHDWVLCALTPGAHQLARPGDVLDPENVRQVDPDLAPEELVDRATLTFWRWVEARKGGDEGRLARLATPDFLELLELQAAPEGVVSSGGGELRALRSVRGFDEAHVLLRWADTPGGVTRSHQTVFKLRRPHGLRTTTALGLSTFRCLQCLAAVTDAETPVCEYCGASLRDAWCLNDLEAFTTWSDQAVALRKKVGGDWARAATPAQREAALGLLVSVARADGVLSEAEVERLELVAAKWQVPPGQLAAALQAPASGTPKFARALALSLTQELVELAFVDGKLEPKERKRLDALATTLGTEAELSRALAQQLAQRFTRG